MIEWAFVVKPSMRILGHWRFFFVRKKNTICVMVVDRPIDRQAITQSSDTTRSLICRRNISESRDETQGQDRTFKVAG